MTISSIHDRFVHFDQSFRSVLTPLPKDGKMWEVAKRVATVAAAPFVYLAMAIVYAIEYLLKTHTVEQVTPPVETGGAPPAATPRIETLDRINHVKKTIHNSSKTDIESGNIVAMDLLLKVKIDEVERTGRLHLKKSPSITYDNFQQKFDSLFASLQNTHDATHRSSSIKIEWFAMGMNTAGTFTKPFAGRSQSIGGSDRGGGIVGKGLNGTIALDDALRYPDVAARWAGFDGDHLWSLHRRDNPDDYEHLERI